MSWNIEFGTMLDYAGCPYYYNIQLCELDPVEDNYEELFPRRHSSYTYRSAKERDSSYMYRRTKAEKTKAKCRIPMWDMCNRMYYFLCCL